MSNFKIVKKGYSQLEVDSYIERLKEDYEAKLAEQKDRIFYLKDQLDKISNSSDNELVTSLVGAVERARMIETSSKNIYELETKKLSLLYTKMEKLLTDENIRNDRSVKQELLELIQDCRTSLQSNIVAQSENVKETTSGDPVKTLLSKMIDFNKETANYNLIKREAKIIEENNKRTIKVIPTNEVIRKEVPSSVKVVQVRKTFTTEKQQAQNVLSNTETTNEFDKFLSQNSDINGANFESIMFTKSSVKPSVLSKYSSRRERIQQTKAKSQANTKSVREVSSSSSVTSEQKSSAASSKSKEKYQSFLSATSKEKSSSETSSIPKYSYSSTSGLTYVDSSAKSSSSKQSSSEVSQKSSSSKLQTNQVGERKSSSSVSKYKLEEENNEKEAKFKKDKSSTKEEVIDLNDGMEISTKSKNAFGKKDSNSSISVETSSKTQNTQDSKTETKNISVSGTSGNTNFFATASYKSTTSSTTTSNPNDELSDEEFLRAYLGDLEYEEQERKIKEEQENQKKTESSSQYSKTTKTVVTSSSSSTRASSSSYVTGGRLGDYSPNETGFDLKEAINPKEDLDEIMKAFNFFNDNKKNKK